MKNLLVWLKGLRRSIAVWMLLKFGWPRRFGISKADSAALSESLKRAVEGRTNA